MADGPPTNLDSLNQRLRNHCNDVGRDYGRARRHVGVLVVAQLLATVRVVKSGV